MRIDDIPENAGLTGEIAGRSVAVFRGSEDIHVFENTCPHLHCPLAWNSDENAWDCPCHNSRFTPGGEVVRGPARQDMRRLAASIDDGEIALG